MNSICTVCEQYIVYILFTTVKYVPQSQQMRKKRKKKKKAENVKMKTWTRYANGHINGGSTHLHIRDEMRVVRRLLILIWATPLAQPIGSNSAHSIELSQYCHRCHGLGKLYFNIIYGSVFLFIYLFSLVEIDI